MKNVNQDIVSRLTPETESQSGEHTANPFNLKLLLTVLIFIITGALIYANTLESPFVFDDQRRILNNPAIRLDEFTVRGLWDAAFGRYSAKSRPVGNISFALNYYFNQYRPAGYHVVNITVHILSGILLWLFLKKTLRLTYSDTAKSRGEWMAPVAAMLWFVNPVQTQSVTYIIQRLNSMAAMFFLLSFLFYVYGRLSTGKRAKWSWFAGAALGWFLALGCKQNTATLPFFIFLYEWYFFQDLNVGWLNRNLKYIFLIIAIFTIIAVIYLGFKPTERLLLIKDYADGEFSLPERILTQFRVVIYYLSLIFYPKPSRLNLDYDFPLSVSLLDPVTTLLALIGLMGLTALGIYLARKQRLISFCIFWFLGNLVIESTVIPLAIIFEHRLYLPSMLVWLIPVILARHYFQSKWLTYGLACVPVVLFAFWTVERNHVWRDAVSLWADCAKKSPNKARIYNNLGTAQFRQNLIAEARQNVSKALALDPELADAHYNLGRILDDEGEITKAAERYRQAVKLNPNLLSALNNLGVALMKQGELDEPIALFNRALQINPEFAETHNNLGLAKSKQGKADEAIAHYTKAIQLNPDSAKAHFNLGVALVEQAETERGIHHIQKALEIEPAYAEAHNNLGGYLLGQGKIDQAFEHFTRAVRIDPDLAQAHNNLGIILIRRGNLEEAISHFKDALRADPEFELAQKNLRRALALRGGKDDEWVRLRNELEARPNDPDLHFKLGNLYLRRDELAKAIVEFEEALSLQPSFLAAQNNLAMAYAADRQYDRALEAFKKMVELDPADASIYYNIAVLYALRNNLQASLTWLKKAIDQGYQNWELIKTDKDLANIRDTEEYKQLVKGR